MRIGLPPHQMPQRFHRCIKYHAGAGVAHYFADAGAHLGFVAVGGALFAEGFVVAVFAHVEPSVGVCFKFGADWAQLVAV